MCRNTSEAGVGKITELHLIENNVNRCVVNVSGATEPNGPTI